MSGYKCCVSTFSCRLEQTNIGFELNLELLQSVHISFSLYFKYKILFMQQRSYYEKKMK